jgi:purine-binding chemotaxis protein CheW
MSFDDIDAADEADDTPIEDTYLIFRVGAEEYAVPVTSVTEIMRLQKSCVRGVINLRGKVIPLVDVRQRFDLAPAVYSDRTVVVVLEFADSATGLIVDGVSEVVEIPPAQIEQRVGWSGRDGSARPVVRAVGKRGECVSFILDVSALLDLHTHHAPTRARAHLEESRT